MTEELSPKIAQLTETTENYLKRIYMLSIQKGQARISEIAKKMDRSLSSVTEAVQRMAHDGFLNYEKYGKITLTDLGKDVAENINVSYNLMNRLLQILGIPKDVSELDACSMEHSISGITMNTIQKFIDFTEADEQARELLKRFKTEILG